MELKALFLNCTLKKSPETSNTEAFINEAEKIFQELKVTTEVVRVVDYNVHFGVTSNEGNGDEWPLILEKSQTSRYCNLCNTYLAGRQRLCSKNGGRTV